MLKIQAIQAITEKLANNPTFLIRPELDKVVSISNLVLTRRSLSSFTNIPRTLTIEKARLYFAVIPSPVVLSQYTRVKDIQTTLLWL